MFHTLPWSHLVVEWEHEPPEPLNDDVIGMIIALVEGVPAPVADVDGANAAQEQLQLPLVEDPEKVKLDDLVEARLERVHLLPDPDTRERTIW